MVAEFGERGMGDPDGMEYWEDHGELHVGDAGDHGVERVDGRGEGCRDAILDADVGPGEYGCGVPACTKQVDSRKTTCPMPKFGTGTRNQAPIGSRMANEDVPGPGNYKLPPGISGGGSHYIYNAAPKPSMSGREKFGSPFGW